MTIDKIKAEFGMKEVLKYGAVALAILFGGFQLDNLVKTNADGVVALHSIVESLDGRIDTLEKAKLEEESFDAGYQAALSELENQ